MSRSNEIWVCTKNGRLISCVSSKTKAIAELVELAGISKEALPVHIVSAKDGTIALKEVLRFRAKPITVK